MKTATYEELTARLDALLAHPEHSWRIVDEVREIELELMGRDLMTMEAA